MTNTPNTKDLADEITIGNIVRLILLQSKLFILLVVASALLSVTYYLTSEKVYKVKSLLQVFSEDQSYGPQSFGIEIFAQSSNTADLNSLEDLYKSRSYLVEVIKEQRLNLFLIEGTALNKNNISNFLVSNLPKNQSSSFKFIFDTDGYDVYMGDSYLGRSQYAIDFVKDEVELNFESYPKLGELEIIYRNPEDIYTSLKSRINVNSLAQSRTFIQNTNGLVEVSMNTTNVEESIGIINFANELFIRKNIETESLQANKAIGFIDQRLNDVKSNLDFEKNALQQFKEKNSTIDVNLEIESVIQKINVIDAKINEIDIEITNAQNNFTSTNPLYISLINQKSALQKQKNEIENTIKSLPLEQQQYFDLFRNVELTQTVYNELLNRKLEYSIREASTLGNIRIVDSAYQDILVSPQLSRVVILFLFLSGLSFAITVIRGFYFLPISNPAELQDNNIDKPIFGVIPKVDTFEDTLDDKEALRLTQSLQSLFVNIKNIDPDTDNQVILLTSATPNCGKSTVSRKLAETISQLDKKVVVLDNDLKRGTQHKEYERKKISLTEFSRINSDNIEQYRITKNLYLIPKITNLSNSFQFLYSEMYKQKLDFFKSYFDYIVVDTPPLLSVSDTSVLMSYSDVNISIIRHNISRVNEVKQQIAIGSQIGIDFDGFVYNFYEKPSSNYGYYGLYGNYAYQYYAKKYLYEAYDYDENKN